MGLVVRIPGLVAPVRLAVAGDLPVHALVAPTDPDGDRLDRLAAGEPVGDLDPVVLAQISRADRDLDVTHAASVDEPQRSAAQRHADSVGGSSTPHPGPDQLEVATFDRYGHLVRRVPGHANPVSSRFATTA